MLKDALRYEKLGLSVIPLRSKGKEPLYPWLEFQKRRASSSEVVKWWNAVPNANIGIVTGQISGIAIIDLDGEEGLREACRLKLTTTVVSLTGNGKHLWYRNPDGNVQNAVRRYPGIDIRGEGGYIIAPPSGNPNGRRYRWLNGLSLNKVTQLPSFPTELLSVSIPCVKEDRKEEGWIAKALEEMKNGNVDTTLTSVLGRFRHDGLSADDARALIEHHPSMRYVEKGHLEAKIENVWNRYKARRTPFLESRENSFRSGNSGLVIHSPTNPDSLKQFDTECRRQSDMDNGGFLQTGYPKLDQMLQGGLKSSRLFTVAARTGVGKTNWLLSVARTICRTGRRVLLFSTEMPYTQIWERYIQTLENAEEFNRHKLFVCDSFAPNIERVEEAINEIKPDVFMFDHINHVSEEQRELGAFMQRLNYLRRKYDVAGIVTAQLNRSADWIDLKTGEKITPRMSMIKGSGTIEQASSRVLLLSETRVMPEGTEIIGNLDKNDNGPKGLIHFMLESNPYKMVEL